MVSSNRDMLADIFPIDGAEPSVHGDLRMGYDDLSAGSEATALLEALPEDVVRAIHRYTFDGPTNVIGLVAHVGGLLEGLDERDPERKAVSAIDDAAAEIDMSRILIEAFRDNPRLPLLGRLHAPGDTSPDAVQVGWGVVSTDEERADAETYLPTIELSMTYLRDPEAVRDTYNQAVLAFMNDVIFRPGVSFRG